MPRHSARLVAPPASTGGSPGGIAATTPLRPSVRAAIVSSSLARSSTRASRWRVSPPASSPARRRRRAASRGDPSDSDDGSVSPLEGAAARIRRSHAPNRRAATPSAASRRGRDRGRSPGGSRSPAHREHDNSRRGRVARVKGSNDGGSDGVDADEEVESWRLDAAHANLDRAIGMVSLADGKVSTLSGLASGVLAVVAIFVSSGLSWTQFGLLCACFTVTGVSMYEVSSANSPRSGKADGARIESHIGNACSTQSVAADFRNSGDFNRHWRAMPRAQLLEYLNEQVYINSIIAMRKFKHIKAGYQYLYAALPLFVLLVGAHGLGL